MNNCSHSGYIGTDVTLKKTLGGVSVVNFSIGVRKSVDKTIWINYVAFEKNAEFIATNFHKGNFIIVQSMYDPDIVEKEGKNITYPKFRVEKVDFGNKVKEEPQPTVDEFIGMIRNEEEFNTGPILDISSDDLPF